MKKFNNRIVLGSLFWFIIFLSGCATTGNMVSESQTPGMTKIFYEIEIKAPKAEVWKVLAKFADLGWSATVIDTHYINQIRGGIGMARHCDLRGDGFVVERIIAWNEGSGYTYAIDDASDPISTDSYVTWSINGDEQQSKVAFEVNYELQYGILGDMLNAMFAKSKFSAQIVEFMGELKTHLENQT